MTVTATNKVFTFQKTNLNPDDVPNTEEEKDEFYKVVEESFREAIGISDETPAEQSDDELN